MKLIKFNFNKYCKLLENLCDDKNSRIKHYNRGESIKSNFKGLRFNSFLFKKVPPQKPNPWTPYFVLNSLSRYFNRIKLKLLHENPIKVHLSN